jgi:predicted dehydrogenase
LLYRPGTSHFAAEDLAMKKDGTFLSRRKFFKRSVTAAAVIGLSRLTARSYGQIVGANNDIRLAVVGCGDCGRAHVDEFLAQTGVRIVALCDVDSAQLDLRMGQITGNRRGGPAAPVARFTDYRKLLESKELDAVYVSTPNHWHALMTIWGCQAGKDVYIEKPTSHEIWEGQQALAASRKYNRIVQAGTQWRSMPNVYEAFEWAKAGNLGKIQVARGFCYKRRASIGKTEGPQPVPATVDYDLWCGPAPADPLRRKNLHYDFHWVWPTGNGDIGNQGAHQMDLARWALNKPSVAPTAFTVGGRFGYVDDGQTPNTLMAVHDYGDSMLIFEVRGLPATGSGAQMDQYKGVSVGNIIECEGGYVSITEKLCAAHDKTGKEIQQFTGSAVQRDTSHTANFLKVMRSRRREDQNGELLEGHLSSSLSHISNISYRLGKQADPDAIKSAIGNDAAVGETFARFQAHLAINNIKLDMDKATLGVPLKIKPDTMTFVDNPDADALLTRKYREPFVVPENV